MSGVGEIIAIVSCVAGLIEALDAGCRIVRQIKARREAHRADGALPPSDALEKTIVEGKESIQKLVEKGNERFGKDFEQGDETAQIAIMRITIQIQNVLLQRLTAARSDDGVVDFEECIDLSDQGCTEALIALQRLYQRKLENARPKKLETTTSQTEKPTEEPAPKIPEKPTLVQRAKTAPATTLPASQRTQDPSPTSTQPPVQDEPTEMPQDVKRKSSKGFGRRLFNGSTYHSALASPPEMPKPSRRSTTASMDKSPTSPNQGRASLVSTSSHDSFIPTQPERTTTWAQGMSRASTLGPMAFMEPIVTTPSAEIVRYGGSCKYAFFMRENGPKGNLEAVNTNVYTENWVLQCKSQKCRFGKQTRDVKTRDQVDGSVYMSHGVAYRWLFLAKSHCAQNEVSSDWPYVCLICQFLNHDPKKYRGHEQLFRHIATHDEEMIGGVTLEGPLTFSNKGIKMEPEFDLKLSPRNSRRRVSSADPNKQTAEELQKRLRALQADRTSKTSSLESAQTDDGSRSTTTDDLYTNHWVENSE